MARRTDYACYIPFCVDASLTPIHCADNLVIYGHSVKPNYTIPRHLLDGVEAFLRVADHRNFRAAAKDLGMSPSAVSQKIQALEERIGVPLLTRTTRSSSSQFERSMR